MSEVRLADKIYIGLGIIGYGMVGNLRKKLPQNLTLYVFDINNGVIQQLIEEFGSYGKIEVTSSAKDLASKVGTVISSLPASKIL